MSDRSKAPPEDLLFLRFRETRDPDFLSEVFDRTAPRLLRFALHVEGRLERAEEHLQATFLVALEKADRWDASRPLLPWLFGILAAELKSAGRERGRHPDPERLMERAGVPAEPSEEAQRAELWSTVQSAIGRLPGTAREILSLRLRDGLSSLEIARRLGISPGAARVRVHRGLERLRRDLPKSLALPGLACLPESRGLEAVRATLLSRAGARSTLAGALGAGVALRALAALFVISTLAGLYRWVTLADTDPVASTLASVTPVNPGASPSTESPLPAGSGRERSSPADPRHPDEPAPEPGEEPPLPNREPLPSELRSLMGRVLPGVVAGTVLDGRFPAEGGWAYLRPGRRLVRPIEDTTPNVLRVPLDAQGKFQFSDLEDGDYQLVVQLGPDRVQVRDVQVHPRDRRRELFAFFRASVWGTAYDELGAPRPGVVVEVRAEERVVVSDYCAQAVTDAQGVYHIGGLLSGTYRVELFGGRRYEFQQNHGREITLAVGAERRVDFGSPRGTGSWRGRLVDGLGRPRGSFFEFHLTETTRGHTTAIMVTKEGSFVKPLAPGTYSIAGWGYGGYTDFGEVTIDEHGLQADLVTPPALVTGELSDPERPADHGNATVWLTCLEATSPRLAERPTRVEESCFLGENTTYAFHAVPPGRYRLHLTAGAIEGAPGGVIEFEVTATDEVLRYDLVCDRP